MSEVVSSLQCFKVKNEEEFRKRDTALTMAVSKFKGGLSEVRSKMGDIKTSLATIAASLVTLSNSRRKQTWDVEESDSESDSHEETPRKTSA